MSLAITGEIAEKIRHPYVKLLLKGTEKSRIHCGFDFLWEKDKDRFVSSMQIGQKIKVVGRYNEFFNKKRVLLHSCILIKGL